MNSRQEQASINIEEARVLRAAGVSYRQIARELSLSTGQLGHVRRALKREKASGTRLRSLQPGASVRDLPVGHCVLPRGLRDVLKASGYLTLGDLADRECDPELGGFEAIAGIGPFRAGQIRKLLDHYGLIDGEVDLKASIERLFPELIDLPANAN